MIMRQKKAQGTTDGLIVLRRRHLTIQILVDPILTQTQTWKIYEI